MIRPIALAPLCLLAACNAKTDADPPEHTITDAVYEVLSADRETYTQAVVQRLQDEEKVIKASEHWREDKLLPLPAQMFRMGAERVAKRNTGLSYSLRSLWPINKQNAARTATETAGLKAVAERPEERYYGEETLGGTRYFTAVYADRAVSEACVTCHNAHTDTPRTDFKVGDVMGGVVIRIARR